MMPAAEGSNPLGDGRLRRGAVRRGSRRATAAGERARLRRPAGTANGDRRSCPDEAAGGRRQSRRQLEAGGGGCGESMARW
jgi:hypothetical protein